MFYQAFENQRGLNVVKCINIIDHNLWPIIARHFPDYMYVFLVDSAPVHGSHVAREYMEYTCNSRGARWLSGRVSDSGARGPGFETYRRRVVSLSETLYSPKVLVNYPGSDGSVPI